MLNDIRDGFMSIDTNRWGGNDTVTIVGVVDYRKLGQNFVMIYDIKNDLVHIVDWIDFDFTSYMLVALREIGFILCVFFSRRTIQYARDSPRRIFSLRYSMKLRISVARSVNLAEGLHIE